MFSTGIWRLRRFFGLMPTMIAGVVFCVAGEAGPRSGGTDARVLGLGFLDSRTEAVAPFRVPERDAI
jgi:hypothetical protein